MKEKRQVSFWRFLQACLSLLSPIFAIAYYIKSGNSTILIATTTFGDASAPSDIAIYLDAVFSTSLSFYRKKLTDNIGALNAILFKLIKSDFYEAYNGGTDIREPLMYALSTADWYSGYDELPDTPTDGITHAVFQASQLAVPISYSMKEVINNRQQILDLVKSKIQQGEMGIQEKFATALTQGAGSGSLATASSNLINGATGIDPLAKIIAKDPTATASIGNIAQGTYTWWRNKTADSAATTYTGLRIELFNMYNSCSLGTGGSPDIILMDQVTYQLTCEAFYAAYRQINSDNDFPFTNFKLPFGSSGTLVVMDDKVPDLYSGTLTYTYGTAFFINTKFMRMRYIEGRDFEMLKDENGKAFAKPLRGDSRLGHMAWMGATTVNNRRKLGVLEKIARTLT